METSGADGELAGDGDLAAKKFRVKLKPVGSSRTDGLKSATVPATAPELEPSTAGKPSPSPSPIGADVAAGQRREPGPLARRPRVRGSGGSDGQGQPKALDAEDESKGGVPRKRQRLILQPLSDDEDEEREEGKDEEAEEEEARQTEALGTAENHEAMKGSSRSGLAKEEQLPASTRQRVQPNKAKREPTSGQARLGGDIGNGAELEGAEDEVGEEEDVEAKVGMTLKQGKRVEGEGPDLEAEEGSDREGGRGQEGEGVAEEEEEEERGNQNSGSRENSLNNGIRTVDGFSVELPDTGCDEGEKDSAEKEVGEGNLFGGAEALDAQEPLTDSLTEQRGRRRRGQRRGGFLEGLPDSAVELEKEKQDEAAAAVAALEAEKLLRREEAARKRKLRSEKAERELQESAIQKILGQGPKSKPSTRKGKGEAAVRVAGGDLSGGHNFSGDTVPHGEGRIECPLEDSDGRGMVRIVFGRRGSVVLWSNAQQCPLAVRRPPILGEIGPQRASAVAPAEASGDAHSAGDMSVAVAEMETNLLPTAAGAIRQALYPKPRPKCAAPSCSEPSRYRHSTLLLPVCSLQCYKVVGDDQGRNL